MYDGFVISEKIENNNICIKLDKLENDSLANYILIENIILKYQKKLKKRITIEYSKRYKRLYNKEANRQSKNLFHSLHFNYDIKRTEVLMNVSFITTSLEIHLFKIDEVYTKELYPIWRELEYELKNSKGE